LDELDGAGLQAIRYNPVVCCSSKSQTSPCVNKTKHETVIYTTIQYSPVNEIFLVHWRERNENCPKTINKRERMFDFVKAMDWIR
jgi:hypothetical protein